MTDEVFSPGASEDYPLPDKPPPPRPARNISYPRIEELKLANGLRVLVFQDERLPRFSIRLGVECGRQDNPVENTALASLAVEMLQEGTEDHTSRELAEAFDRWAIQLQSDVYLEFSSIGLSVLESHLQRALELLSELLLRPVFPDVELEKIKVRWHSTLVAQRAQSAFLAREMAFHTHFAGHPYQRIEVAREDLATAKRDMVRDFYRDRFTPERSLLLFAGPIDLKRAGRLAERFLGDWPSERKARSKIAKPPVWSGRLVRLVDRPHSVQSRIQVSGSAPARPSRESLLFRLTNQALGGSSSSRIFLNLREDKGYTYGAYSSYRSHRLAGLHLASADVGTEMTVPAVREVLHEMERFLQEPPGQEELRRSREELIGSLIRRMETAASVGLLEIQRRLCGLPADYYARYIPRLRNFGPDRVLESARRWIGTDNCLITVVGDRTLVEKPLREFGPVEVFDTHGHRLD